jgi:hypothetical protein
MLGRFGKPMAFGIIFQVVGGCVIATTCFLKFIHQVELKINNNF